MLFGALLLATTIPTLASVGLMLAACRVACSTLGWHAITYAPAVGYILASIGMAVLGMRAFRSNQAITPGHKQKTLAATYTFMAAFGLAAMAAAPHLGVTDELISDTIKHVTKSI